MRLLSLLIAVGVIGLVKSEPVSYEGYSVVRLFPRNQEQVDSVVSWMLLDHYFSPWNEIRGANKTIDVLLSPEQLQNYKDRFVASNLEYQVINSNVQEAISKESAPTARRITKFSTSIVGTFARFNQISSYLDSIVYANPFYASTYLAGKTHERRDLKVLRLKTPTAQRKVWIDCGIHAREWITPATCVWMIDRLVKDYNEGNPTARSLLNHFEIHIIPVLNPDGYEYTFTNDRMWRKNRNPGSSQSCSGVDLNRNFNLAWMKNGASSNPCSEVYAGRYGGSELENQAVERVILSNRGTWDAFLTFHSYGNWWFTPYGYTKSLPADYAEMYRVAKVATDTIKNVHGTQYTIGSSANLLYLSAGGSEDWAKDVGGIKYAYCVELGPDDSDSSGFLLPQNKIQPIGEETYQGVLAFLNEIKKSR